MYKTRCEEYNEQLMYVAIYSLIMATLFISYIGIFAWYKNENVDSIYIALLLKQIQRDIVSPYARNYCITIFPLKVFPCISCSESCP